MKKKHKGKRKWNTNHLTDISDGESAEVEEEFYLKKVGSTASHPIIVNLEIERKTIPMEVDTWAAFSVISEETYKTA